MTSTVMTATAAPRRRGPDPDVIKRAAELVASGVFHTEGPYVVPCAGCGGGRHEHTGRMAKRPESRRHRYIADPAWVMALAAIHGDRRSIAQTISEYERRRRARKYGKGPREGSPVSISDVGRCRRQIMYRHLGADTNPVSPSGAWVGSAIHDKAEAAARKLYPWLLLEHEVDVPGLDRKARIDKYDPILGVVDDTKSAGMSKWQRIGDEGPSLDMWEQVLVYCLLLEQAGNYVALARISPVDRDKGRCEQFTRPWDDEAREIAVKAMSRLLDTATALDNGDELPKDRPGPSTDAICADYCPFRKVCWNEDAAEEAQRSPESYAALGPDPDEEQIEWAIRNHVEAKETGKKKLTEEAKALLTGIPVGRYGDYQLRNGKSVTYNYKGQAAALLDWAKTPEGERPNLDVHAEPAVNITWYPDTSRVREATTKDAKLKAIELDKLMRSGIRRQPAGYEPIRSAAEEAEILAGVPDAPPAEPAPEPSGSE